VSIGLLVAGAAAVAIAGGSAPAKPVGLRAYVRKVYHTKPQAGPEGQAPGGDDSWRGPHSLYAAGNAVALHVDVPPGRYEVAGIVLVPEIPGHVRFPLKVGEKNYYYRKGPDGSAPLLSGVAKAANVAAEIGGTVAGGTGDPRVAALAAALELIGTVSNKLSDAVARSRVKIWARWRAGEYGPDDARELMREYVRAYFDPQLNVALKAASVRGEWRWEGDAAGGWPVRESSGEWSATPPLVTASKLGDGWLRLAIAAPQLSYPREVRWTFTVDPSS